MLVIRNHHNERASATAVISLNDDATRDSLLLGHRYKGEWKTLTPIPGYYASPVHVAQIIDVEGLYKDGTKTIVETWHSAAVGGAGGNKTYWVKRRLPDSVENIKDTFKQAQIALPPIRRSIMAAVAVKVRAAFHALLG